MNALSNLNKYPKLLDAIDHLVTDDNPVKIMLILTDLEELGMKHGLLDAEQFQSLGQLHALLAELVLVREDHLST
jgi:hypothetical protein